MKPSHASGFTLLELMVAVSLTLVLAGVLLLATQGTLQVWRRAQDAFTTDTQAQLCLDQIERDLECAVLRPDLGTSIAADVINDPAVLVAHGWLWSERCKPAGSSSARLTGVSADGAERLAEARFGLSGAWLRLFTMNHEAAGTVPVAISFGIARRPISGAVSSANPAAFRYSLFRAAVLPENTFAAGYDLLSGYSHASATPPVQRAAGTITNPALADAIATNVVDLGLWFYVRDTSGELRRIFPTAPTDTSFRVPLDAPPGVADVMIRVLTDEGAVLLDHLERAGAGMRRPLDYPDDASWWWGVVEAHSRVYVRRIQIRSEVP